MAISDATLRSLAGERNRIERSKHLTADPPALREIAQTSEMAAELLRHRAAERADKERVRQAVLEACLRFAAGLIDGETADAIALRAAVALAASSLECPVHRGSVHGGEAEELRKGVEQIMLAMPEPFRGQLIRLLDRVDARDSLAHLERVDQLDVTTATPPSDVTDVTDSAFLAESAPPVTASLIDDQDREQLERWRLHWGPHRGSVSDALGRLLAGVELTHVERDCLVMFASNCNGRWPVTCTAVARVLDGMS